jgi:uncharacterized phage infection (PIP) family protein YhgE
MIKELLGMSRRTTREGVLMGLMDKLTAGIEKVAEGADKAFDKGKTKVGEMQIEMQMDGLAKKLGYLVFDFYRGRQVDQDLRQKLLDELAQLEDRLLQIRAEAAAKSEAEAALKAERAAQTAGAAFVAPETGAAADAAPGGEAVPPTGM